MTDVPPATTARQSWLVHNPSAAYWLAFVLLTLYVAPLLLLALALAATSGFEESHWALNLFVAFTVNHENTLKEFHTILLPIISMISVTAFTKRPSRLLIVLACLVIFYLVVAIVLSVYFDLERTRETIQGAVNDFSPEQTSAFFSRVRETLLMFAMLLLGIGVVNREPAEGGKA